MTATRDALALLACRTRDFTTTNPEMTKKREPYDGPCPVEPAIQVFGGKWKPAIIYFLLQRDSIRFNELRKAIPEVTQRMLTRQLRELERDGMVKRTEFAEVPPRVQYSPTTLARNLRPVFKAIEAWGNASLPEVKRTREDFDAKREQPTGSGPSSRN